MQSQLGFYYATKLASEMFLENYAKQMNIIILRIFFAYGAGQRKSMLIPRLVHSIHEGKPIQIQGDHGITINPIHASDAARAIKAAMDLSGLHIINIGGAENINLRQIGDIIGRQLNKQPVFEEKAAPPQNLLGDISKMCRLLGKPRICFHEGIADYIKTSI